MVSEVGNMQDKVHIQKCASGSIVWHYALDDLLCRVLKLLMEGAMLRWRAQWQVQLQVLLQESWSRSDLTGWYGKKKWDSQRPWRRPPFSACVSASLSVFDLSTWRTNLSAGHLRYSFLLTKIVAARTSVHAPSQGADDPKTHGPHRISGSPLSRCC
jgi:hypothetical protein